MAPCPCRALPRVAALLQGAASKPHGGEGGGMLSATGTLWGRGDVGRGGCGDVGARLGSPKSLPLLCTPRCAVIMGLGLGSWCCAHGQQG